MVRAHHQGRSSLNRPKKLTLGGDLSKTLLPVADELCNFLFILVFSLLPFPLISMGYSEFDYKSSKLLKSL